jgi:hypothetical protein
MAIQRYGTDLSTVLQENENTGPRKISANEDTMTKTFNSTLDAYEALIPAIGSDLSAIGYPDHKVEEINVSPVRARQVQVSLVYKKTPPVITLPPPTTLPATEIEYDGGTEQRHLGAHPSYVTTWLGTPKSKHPSTGALIDDPLGTPTIAPTKPGVTGYLIPTIIFRQKRSVASGPAVGTTSTDLGKLDEPPGETGTNRWLKTGYKARKNKAQNYWEITEEWTFNPLGTWDTDIYTHT